MAEIENVRKTEEINDSGCRFIEGSTTIPEVMDQNLMEQSKEIIKVEKEELADIKAVTETSEAKKLMSDTNKLEEVCEYKNLEVTKAEVADDIDDESFEHRKERAAEVVEKESTADVQAISGTSVATDCNITKFAENGECEVLEAKHSEVLDDCEHQISAKVLEICKVPVTKTGINHSDEANIGNEEVSVAGSIEMDEAEDAYVSEATKDQEVDDTCKEEACEVDDFMVETMDDSERALIKKIQVGENVGVLLDDTEDIKVFQCDADEDCDAENKEVGAAIDVRVDETNMSVSDTKELIVEMDERTDESSASGTNVGICDIKEEVLMSEEERISTSEIEIVREATVEEAVEEDFGENLKADAEQLSVTEHKAAETGRIDVIEVQSNEAIPVKCKDKEATGGSEELAVEGIESKLSENDARSVYTNKSDVHLRRILSDITSDKKKTLAGETNANIRSIALRRIASESAIDRMMELLHESEENIKVRCSGTPLRRLALDSTVDTKTEMFFNRKGIASSRSSIGAQLKRMVSESLTDVETDMEIDIPVKRKGEKSNAKRGTPLRRMISESLTDTEIDVSVERKGIASNRRGTPFRRMISKSLTDMETDISVERKGKASNNRSGTPFRMVISKSLTDMETDMSVKRKEKASNRRGTPSRRMISESLTDMETEIPVKINGETSNRKRGTPLRKMISDAVTDTETELSDKDSGNVNIRSNGTALRRMVSHSVTDSDADGSEVNIRSGGTFLSRMGRPIEEEDSIDNDGSEVSLRSGGTFLRRMENLTDEEDSIDYDFLGYEFSGSFEGLVSDISMLSDEKLVFKAASDNNVLVKKPSRIQHRALFPSRSEPHKSAHRVNFSPHIQIRLIPPRSPVPRLQGWPKVRSKLKVWMKKAKENATNLAKSLCCIVNNEDLI